MRALDYYSAESDTNSGKSSDPKTSSFISDCSDREREKNLRVSNGEIKSILDTPATGVSNLEEVAELIDQHFSNSWTFLFACQFPLMISLHFLL